ncbi:MAG TPA: hypothetical protein VE090_04400, partial [Methylomirabilota bacterium]|nr:hypothetical protein [Methylomirabilota bacterium]
MKRVFFVGIKDIFKNFSSKKVLFLSSSLLFGLLFSIGGFFTFVNSGLHEAGKRASALGVSDPQVLATATKASSNSLSGEIAFNLPSLFTDQVLINADASVSGKLTAPNILYGIVAGQNITISGDLQNPTISATSSGVQSLQGLTGDLAFTQGTGITLNGLTITNSDPGSSQKIFENIKVGSSTITAGSNTDTIEFVAGSGISLSADTSNKKLTITGNSGPSGLTTNGVLYADSSTSFVSLTPGTSGYILQSNGTGTPPTWVAPGSVNTIPFTNITSG